MGRSKWLLLLLIPMLFGFDTRNPFRTRGPFKAYDFTVGGGSAQGSCTDGSNCYCDRVTNPSDPFYDASLLSCEDFENANFYSTTDWVSGSGGTTDFYRGNGSDWYADYGQPDFKSSSTYGNPSAPRIPNRCFSGTPGAVCGDPLEYCSTAQGNLVDGQGADCWGPGVNAVAVMDIQRAGDFDEANSALTLTGGSGATGDVGAGDTHMAYRIPTSGGSSTGVGHERFANSTNVGITMAHAYSSNLAATGIISEAWKHEEWSGVGGSGGFSEFWNLGNIGDGERTGDSTYFPYKGIIFTEGLSACSTALAAAQVLVGSAACYNDGVKLGWSAQGNAFPGAFQQNIAYQNSGVTNYNRATHFPYGTWTCHRAYISGMGTSNTTIQVWNDNILVFHMTGFDGASAMKNQNYNDYWLNAYSNKMVLSGINEVAYRYRDNVHIRNGPPVDCSQIGY